MSTFIFSYRAPHGYVAFQPETTRAWTTWFESLASDLVDVGQPVAEAHQIGECGADSRLGGFTVVTADDLDAAVALAQGCPGLQHGFGVEVGALVPVGGDAARGQTA
jgi:hypothetical protein